MLEKIIKVGDPGQATSRLDGDKGIFVSRIVGAPRGVVWQALTHPEHIGHWWGPHGFTTVTKEMDVRPGGRWEHVMRGPDGQEYPNVIKYLAVEPPQRIVFANSGGLRDARPVQFNSVWTLEEISSRLTRVSIAMTFALQADRDCVVKEYGAIQGGEQTLSRLDGHTAALSTAMFQELTIERTYIAPPAVVFNAWVDPAILRQWLGPAGFTNPVCEVNLQVGGRWRIVMRAPDGQEYPCGGVYRIIEPPRLLEFTNIADDKDGRPILDGYTAVSFESDGDGTKLTLRTRAAALAPYAGEYLKGMRAGWSQSLDRLEGLMVARQH